MATAHNTMKEFSRRKRFLCPYLGGGWWQRALGGWQWYWDRLSKWEGEDATALPAYPGLDGEVWQDGEPWARLLWSTGSGEADISLWGILRNVRLESCEIGINRVDCSWVILERHSLVVDFEDMSTAGELGNLATEVVSSRCLGSQINRNDDTKVRKPGKSLGPSPHFHTHCCH